MNGFPNLIYTWVFVCHQSFYKQCDFLAQDIFRDVCDSCAVENHGSSASIFTADCSCLFLHDRDPALWLYRGTDHPGKQSAYPPASFLLPLISRLLEDWRVFLVLITPDVSLGRAVLYLEAWAGRGMLAKACSFLECRLKDRRNSIDRRISQQYNTKQGFHT